MKGMDIFLSIVYMIMVLPVNLKPQIATYADLSYVNSIISIKQLLKLSVIEDLEYRWVISDNEMIHYNAGIFEIVEVGDKDTTGSFSRCCNKDDEIIIHVDYFRKVDGCAYISFFIGQEDVKYEEFGVTNYGFCIDNIMRSYQKEYTYYKLSIHGKITLFYASTNGEDWDGISRKKNMWQLGEADNLQIGVSFSLGNSHYNDWLNMNYVQLFYDPEEFNGRRWIDYFAFPRKDDDHLYGAYSQFLDTQYLDTSEIIDVYGSIVQFIQSSIRYGYYVQIRLDEYYVPERWAFQSTHFEHDNLIYGYDKENFYLLGYNVHMISSLIDLDSMIKSCTSKHKIIRYKMHINEHPMIFKKENLINSMKEYLMGVDSGIHSSHIISQRKGIYGIHILEMLYKEEKEKELLISDIRVSHLIYEHCMMMSERIRFLVSRGYIAKEEDQTYCLNQCKEIVKTAQVIRNLVIKYSFSGGERNSIFDMMKELYMHEKTFYSQLIHILND